MRPSQKGRNARNKGGRKPIGNVVNRVYESAGPEGKVRGTPQQIIDKYLLLARDAQTSGDRVLAESFQQHAEHYIRLLSAAYQQNEERRQARDAQSGEHYSSHGHDESGGGNDQDEDVEDDAQERRRDYGRPRSSGDGADHGQNRASGGGMETIEPGPEDAGGPVETPEAARSSAAKADAPAAGQDASAAAPESAADPADASENGARKPAPRRRRRKPQTEDQSAETATAEAGGGDEAHAG